MADMHTLYFTKTDMIFFPAAQLMLNKFQVYKILIIPINFIEKKDKMLKTESRIFYFLMCICSYGAKSDTEAVFCTLGSVPVLYCLNPILNVRIQTIFQTQLLPFLDVVYKKVHRNGLTQNKCPISDPIWPLR